MVDVANAACSPPIHSNPLKMAAVPEHIACFIIQCSSCSFKALLLCDSNVLYRLLDTRIARDPQDTPTVDFRVVDDDDLLANISIPALSAIFQQLSDESNYYDNDFMSNESITANMKEHVL
jgi:hypothetical protein